MNLISSTRYLRLGTSNCRSYVRKFASTSQTHPVQSKLLSELVDRGYIYQCTDLKQLDKRIFSFEEAGADVSGRPVTMYVGFDATASTLHAGSLIQLMVARKFLQHGHHVICLVGGGTTKIGDPSGKDSARKMLSNKVRLGDRTQIPLIILLLI